MLQSKRNENTQKEEYITLNQGVQGSNPWWRTKSHRFNIDKNCEKTFDEHSDSLRVFYFVNLEILKINGIRRSDAALDLRIPLSVNGMRSVYRLDCLWRRISLRIRS